MKLLHLSRSDIAGGAAQATYQLHTLLRDKGHQSVMAVRRKESADPDVVPIGARSLMNCSWPERLERVRSRLSGGYHVNHLPGQYFNRNLAPAPDLDAVLKTMPNPDVLFLHWVTNLMTVADIRRLAERVACPIVWVMMDMEPMTGGCHYPADCTRFQTECHSCPQLQPGARHDWAQRTWREKHRELAGLPITFLAPTKWIADRLATSGLFREHPVARIPLPMNSHMRPLNQFTAREILGAPADKKIILVGSENLKDPRKGMDRLLEAAQILKKKNPQKEILFWLLGNNGRALAEALPFPSHIAGYIRNDIELALTYQSADVFACPSLEDAGPMMVSQAMLCGTPVVAFDTGIVPDIVIPGKNGFIARHGDAEDFANGLKAMLADDGFMGRQAAEAASRHHDPSRIADLYTDLLGNLTRHHAEHGAS